MKATALTTDIFYSVHYGQDSMALTECKNFNRLKDARKFVLTIPKINPLWSRYEIHRVVQVGDKCAVTPKSSTSTLIKES